MKQLCGFNLERILRNCDQACPDKIAIIEGETKKRYTYHEINLNARKVANMLKSLGIRKGDVISLLMRNCVEFVEISFAAFQLGAVVAPLNYRLSPNEARELLNFSEAKILFYSEEFKNEIEMIKKDLLVKNFICVGALSDSEEELSYELFREKMHPNEDSIVFDEHDSAMLIFTSGTTGLPKGFMLTHYMLMTSIYTLSFMFQLTHNDVLLTVMPLHGRVGFCNMLLSIYTRATNILLNFSTKKVLQLIEKEKVTFTNWVPTMAQMMLNEPELGKYDLGSLRGINFAGSSLPKAILEGVWEQICPYVHEHYGMQEAGTIVSITPEMKRKKPHSCGVAIPKIEYRIVDQNGRGVPQGEVGEIITKSPSSAVGYYKEEEKTRQVFKNGWVYTGDLGRQDNEGYLYIVGRTKDIIVSGGQNIFAPEIEEVLFAHPAIADCAVVGLPDEKWGEKVVAVVVLKEGANLSENEVGLFCQEKLARFKIPKKVFFAENIPKTATGKVQKYLIVKNYEGYFNNGSC